MCSECKDGSTNDWIELDCNGNKFLIAKIANANNLPSGDFKGKVELLQSIKKTKNDYCLFYIFISHKDKDLKLTYSDFISTTEIQKPNPVFRMPGFGEFCNGPPGKRLFSFNDVFIESDRAYLCLPCKIPVGKISIT